MALQLRTTKEVTRGNLILLVNEADGQVVGAFLKKLDDMKKMQFCTLGDIDSILQAAVNIDMKKQEIDIIKKKDGTEEQKRAKETIINP